MNEERYIRQKMAGRQPFSVPEGYFDDFQTRIMSSLPEAAPHSEAVGQETDAARKLRRSPLRLWWAAAACLVVMVAATSLYFNHGAQQSTYEPQTAEVASDQFIDDMADYAMVDNTDIYACLEDY